MTSFVFVVRESPAGKLGIGLGIDPQQGRIVITHVAGDGHVGRNVHSEDAVAEGDQLVGVGGTVFKVLHEGAVVEHGARMGAGELRVALPALGRADVLGGKSDAQLVALFGGTPVDEIAVRTKLTEVELDRAFELLKTSTRPFKLSLHRDRKEDFALEGMWMRARIARVGARWRRVWVAVEVHRLPVLVAVFSKKQWPAPAAEDATAIDAFRKRVRANAAQHAELGNVCAAADSGAGDSDITVLKAGAAPLLGRRGRRKRRLSLVEDTTRLLLRASCAEERARWLREVHAAQVRNERHALAERALISTKRADETRRRYNLRKAVVAQSLSMLVETSAGSVGRAALAAAAPPIDAAAAVEAVSLVATALSAARVAAAASADAAEAMKEMGDHVEDTLVRVAREDALARGGVWVQCKRGGRFAKRWCVLDAGYTPGDPPRTPALVGLFVHADIAASIHHALRVGDLVLIHGRRSVGSYDGRYGVVVSVGSGTAGMKRRQTDDGVYPDDAPAIEVDVRQDGTYDAPAGVVSLSGVDVWRVLRPSDASRAFRALEGGQFDEEAAIVRRAATRAVAAHALAVARVEAKSGTTTDVHLTVDGAAVEGLAADKDDVEEVWTLRFKSRAERDAWLAGVGRALTRLRRVMSEGRLLTVPNRRRLELRRALVLASVVHGAGRRSDATIAAFASVHATTNDVALLSLTTATDLAVHNARSASRVAELCSESASREVERTAALSTAKTSSAGSSSGTVADSADAWQLQGVVAPPVPAHTDHRQGSSSASWSRNGSGDAHGEFDDATTAAVERRANELTVMDAAHKTAARMAASSAKARASASAVSAALAARRAAHFARIAVGASRTSVRVLLNTLAVRLCAIASCAAAAAAASATLAEHIGVRSAEAERARSRKVRTVGASRAMAAGITALIAAKGSARSAKISERGVRDIGQRALGARIAPVRDAAAHAARRAATSAAHSTAEADASIVAVTESEALIAALFGSERETQSRRGPRDNAAATGAARATHLRDAVGLRVRTATPRKASLATASGGKALETVLAARGTTTARELHSRKVLAARAEARVCHQERERLSRNALRGARDLRRGLEREADHDSVLRAQLGRVRDDIAQLRRALRAERREGDRLARAIGCSHAVGPAQRSATVQQRKRVDDARNVNASIEIRVREIRAQRDAALAESTMLFAEVRVQKKRRAARAVRRRAGQTEVTQRSALSIGMVALREVERRSREHDEAVASLAVAEQIFEAARAEHAIAAVQASRERFNPVHRAARLHRVTPRERGGAQ